MLKLYSTNRLEKRNVICRHKENDVSATEQKAGEKRLERWGNAKAQRFFWNIA